MQGERLEAVLQHLQEICKKPSKPFPDDCFVNFYHEWFYGAAGSLLLEKEWGRDLGCPERKFYYAYEVNMVSRIYRLWMQLGSPVFQSVNYFKKGERAGVLVALEKVFLEIDAQRLEEAVEAELEVYEHLSQYGKPLTVFSGRRGFHNYIWLPRIVVGEPKFLKILYNEILVLMGIPQLAGKIQFLDSSVLEAARIARVPYTVHEKSGYIVFPLDEDFKPIESLRLEECVRHPLPGRVLDEAVNRAKTRFLLQKARVYRTIIGAERKQLKRIALGLPDYVRFILENGVDEGCRNNAAFILATWLKAQGKTSHEVLQQLIEWNYRNRPPLEVRELENVVKSVFRHGYKPVSRKTAEEWLKSSRLNQSYNNFRDKGKVTGRDIGEYDTGP